MKLGFYYHSPFFFNENKIYVPSYIGVFFESLASDIEELQLFGHHVNDNHLNICDYKIKNKM